MAKRTEIRLLTRFRDQQGQTLYFTAGSLGGRSGRCKETFIDPAHLPEFEGNQAWFELERVPAVPWAFWRAVRPVAPPEDWEPAPRPKPTPAQLPRHR